MDGAQLRRWRLARTMSVRGLAEKSGVNHSAISEIERGRRSPHPSTIGKLADALGIDPKELVKVEQAVAPYYVSAAKFLAWWARLIELDHELPENMTQEVWFSRGQPIRILLGDVTRIGTNAQILRFGVEDGAIPDSVAFVKYVNPVVDPNHDEVDMQQNEYFWNDGIDRASSLISHLERITGIPEHD
ncbi:MAG: helix-turn-helix transcriptional regulator [Thermomicrobiales bacterium]